MRDRAHAAPHAPAPEGAMRVRAHAAPHAPAPEGVMRIRSHAAPHAPAPETDMPDGPSEKDGYDPGEIVREVRSRESEWRIARTLQPDVLDEPDEPHQPYQPAQPEEPDQPDQLSEADEPEESDEPNEPEAPEAPDEPDEPGKPAAESEEPDEPQVEAPQMSFAEGADSTHMTRRLCARLGQLLLDEKLLSEAQLEAALRRQKETGERLGSILISEGYLDEKSLLTVLESQHGVPAVHLDEISLDPSLAELIPRDMARRNLMVPFALRPDAVDVAMVDPTDFVSMAHVRFAAGLRPNVFITTVGAAERAIERLYAADEHEAGETSEASEEKDTPTAREHVRRMILERDSVLLASDRDPRKYYELAVSIEDFVDEILRKAREG